MISALRQDLLFAVRSLRRTPAFTLTALIVLGFGIGSAMAIFTVLNATVLRPLPYADAERLYVIHPVTRDGRRIPSNVLHFREWQRRDDVVRTAGADRTGHRHDWRDRRSRASQLRSCDTVALPDARRATGARTPVRARRGHRRTQSRDRARPRPVDHPIRRRPRGRWQERHAGWRAVHRHRCAAGDIHVRTPQPLLSARLTVGRPRVVDTVCPEAGRFSAVGAFQLPRTRTAEARRNRDSGH